MGVIFNWAHGANQRSVCAGERKNSETSELSAQPEESDMKEVMTKWQSFQRA